MAAGVGGAGRLGTSSTSMAAGSRAPPAKLRPLVWAAVFGDPSGTVDSARAAAHQCGGELHTTARVLTIVDQNSP
jgi:hypothetical protein